MGFFDKLFGRNEEPQQQQQGRGMYAGGQNPQQGQPQQMTDEQAIARYRYMLKTAPPETIEQAHEEAFGRLTPEQRRMVFDQLSTTLPENEKQTAANQDDPRSLARMATRAEMRQPGTIERTFSNVGPMGGGMSMGGLMAGSFFSSMAGMFIGSMLVNQFLGDSGYNDGFADGSQEGNANGEGGEGSGDTGQDTGGDYGASDGVQADAGGDYGSSGDFGGGDFGGGDFG